MAEPSQLIAWNIGGVTKRVPSSLSPHSPVPAVFRDRFVKLCEREQPPPEWFQAQAEVAQVAKFGELTLGEFLRMVVAVEHHFWLSGNDIDLTGTDEIPNYRQAEQP